MDRKVRGGGKGGQPNRDKKRPRKGTAEERGRERDTKVSKRSRKVKRDCYERSCVGLGIENLGTDFF